MPYRTVYEDAELFLEHKGIKVFHTYDGGDIEDRNDSYFTTNEAEPDESEFHFDVRELKSWYNDPTQPPFMSGGVKDPELEDQWTKYHERDGRMTHYRNVIIAAIESGEITQDSTPEIDLDRKRPVFKDSVLQDEYDQGLFILPSDSDKRWELTDDENDPASKQKMNELILTDDGSIYDTKEYFYDSIEDFEHDRELLGDLFPEGGE